MNESKSSAPSSSVQFDKVYSSSFAHWIWSDIRIPKELQELVTNNKPVNSLELGCGLGRFTKFMALQGIDAVGVDFSSVAIEKAKINVANEKMKPTFLVGDVTNLKSIIKQFDVSYDIGCFHCLNEEAHKKYVAELFRLLKPGSYHLIWALDTSPSGIKLHPDYIAKTVENKFRLDHSNFSRRRIAASHWYWLVREK